MAIPPKGVSDSPYKKYAIERALEEMGVPSTLSNINNNTATVASRLNTLATKIDETNRLLQELIDK